MESQFATAVLVNENEDNDPEPDDQEYLPSTSKKHKRTVKTGIDVHIPPDILKRPNVVQSLVRNKVPSTSIASVMYEIISEVNGDPAKLSLSYASTERYRVECTTHISESI